MLLSQADDRIEGDPMTNSLTTEKKEALLLAAFSALMEEESLNSARDSIEQELNGFIKHIKSKFKPEQRLFESVESRKKSEESFLEKIYRKDYIHTWIVSDDLQINTKLIAKNLTDLLGYRINCYFLEDEYQIYKAIEQYYNDSQFGESIKLDFSENTTQKNGHKIYKFSGLYKDQFHFEVQIKSMMHNIWGEVEHKTIYKSRNYDVNTTTKEIFTEEIYNILNASDKQLNSLFRSQIQEKELVFALFFEKTKDIVASKSRTYILSSHYNGFFKLFDKSHTLIQNYVALTLLGQEYSAAKAWTVPEDGKVTELKSRITSEFFEYYLLCQYYIFELLYKDTNYDMFLTLLSDTLCRRFLPDETDDPFAGEEFMQDAFDVDDDEDSRSEEKNYEAVLERLNEMIGGRKNDHH